MECINQLSSLNLPEPSEANENDALFMEIIREFPTIYNRASKDFKDRNKKANSWKRIAEYLGQTVEDVKRRYESIRTSFSRYLQKRRGRSGSGVQDTPLEPKFEHLRWLLSFINTRQSTGNFRKATLQEAQESNNLALSLDDGRKTPIQDEISSNSILHFSGAEDSDVDTQNADLCDPDQQVSGNKGNQTPSSTASLPDLSSSVEPKNHKHWSGRKTSRKRQIEETDMQLKQTIAGLHVAMKRQAQAEAVRSQQEINMGDQDYHYCMSLVPRMKSLDPRQKAILRSQIEKAFMEVEFGIIVPTHSNYLGPQPSMFQHGAQLPANPGFQVAPSTSSSFIDYSFQKFQNPNPKDGED